MSKLEKMFDKVKKTTITINSYYYGYINSRRCSEEYKKFLRGSVRVLPSPIPDVEVVYVSQESRTEMDVWMDETEDSLRQCVHEHSSGTSWVGAGSYIAIRKGDRLFFASIGGMRRWTVEDIIFKEEIAIISGQYEAPNMMPGFGGRGFQPGDMGYYKEEYEWEVPRVEKISL